MTPAIPETGDLRTAIEAARTDLAALHAHLPRAGLVTWTSGNISARIPGTDLIVIKPSGIEYDHLTPDTMVVCDLAGHVIEGDYQPSSDTGSHAHVYRHRPDIGGIVHTHSPYATAFAARGEPIPCVLTAIADEFGGEIPIGPFALIGDETIGAAILQTLTHTRSPAVLLRNHGVFTIGPTPRAAVKAAVMTEDAARTVHLAQLHGPLTPLDDADIQSLNNRYTHLYGQPGRPNRNGAA
jgi:L-ribulose-5-phosphate 4-epimerase